MSLRRAAVAAAAMAALALACAGGALAKDPDLKSLQRALQKAVAAKDAKAQAEALGRIAALDDPKAAHFLLDYTLKAADRAAFLLGKEALGKVKSEAGAADLAKALTNPKSALEPQVLAAEALGTIEAPAAVSALAEALRAGRPAVRVVAARALGKKRSADALRALAEVYRAEEASKGKIFFEVRRALVGLTGLAYATGDEWAEWVDQHAASFDFEKDRGKEPDEGGTVVRRKAFFGSPIESTAAVFIVDISGSMEMWDPSVEVTEESWKEPRPPAHRVRMERLKKELVDVLGTLGPEVRFTILAFSDQLKRFEAKLVPADEKTIAAAKKFVEGLRAGGGTYTDLPLEEALANPEVDTIYLLSDGAPMKVGEDKADAKYRDEILASVEKKNRYRGVTIHCIGFDGPGIWPKHLGARPTTLKRERTEDFVRFMKDLAAQNGGTYRSVP